MKPAIPQGTRDFSPEIVRRRQYILQTIRSVFELYGYQPLETPSMEQLSTLMGKYGEEGDRLIFKILNNGLADPKNADKAKAAFEKVLEGKSTPDLTERALRYDLTIPFARYVVMHQNDIAFPFRRYQMQPVWRGDRPGHGRYREFWQCDADIVGSNSLINEAELIAIYREAFHRLQIPGISVKINSRKVLAGLAACCGAPELLTDITVAIDKLDKIGMDGVKKELQQRGLAEEPVAFIEQYLTISGDNETRLQQVAKILENSELAQQGIAELRDTLAYHGQLAVDAWKSCVTVDFTLARGLNYYTGIIAEVTTDAVKMGSIGGGGRYDDLTGLFGLKGLSGVGISFGVDRIYDVMESLDLFPAQLASATKVIFVFIDHAAETRLISYVQQLRAAGVAAEMYPDKAKFDKQMKYADKRKVPYVAIVGENELAEGLIGVKNMKTGMQEKMNITELVSMLS